MDARRLLLLSNSRNADGAFLAHALDALAAQLQGVRTACFVPWAGVDDPAGRVHRARAASCSRRSAWPCAACMPSDDPVGMVRDAEAVIVGGGNTFRLLERMQHHALLGPVRARVAEGMPYVGWSAGSVLACPTIGTTNDMPIIAPDGLAALALAGFQINAHFTDAHPPGFRGETRRERLAEYGVLNPDCSVVGLPEGNWLVVQGAEIRVQGPHDTPWFRGDQEGVLPADEPVQRWLEPNGAPSFHA